MYDLILPILEVKNYLRIDSDFTEDDGAIERMRDSALEYISKATNHIIGARDKDYFQNELCAIEVVDTPINSIPADLTPMYYSGYVKFIGSDKITLNVGYATRAEVPSALLDCALQMVSILYYDSETNKVGEKWPEAIINIINQYRRYIAG